jgi:hypothetical protein
MAAAASTKFDHITAQNPALNSTLEQAHVMQKLLAGSGKIADPRIYANGWNAFYPETDQQNNSDLPSWVNLASDAGAKPDADTLQEMGLKEEGPPVYLLIYAAEYGQNFCDVASLWRQCSIYAPRLYEMFFPK